MSESRSRGPLLAVAAVGLVAVGVVAGAMLWRTPSAFRDSGLGARDSGRGARDSGLGARDSGLGTRDSHSETGMPNPGSRVPDPGAGDGVVTLTPEMMTRAGIKTVAATTGTATTPLHIPGVVQPNGYKEVAVTALVSGRVTQVRAELGQRVMLGETLAIVYSPELADAQTTFIAVRAEHAAHDQRQARAQRLFAIGAVSRQELEALEAEKARKDQEVETARARLVLLGIPEERTQRLATPLDVVTTFEVRAPISGVITKRSANPGVIIDPATPLFTVVDLATVWVIGDLYERDFAAVHVGNPVTITTSSYPGLVLKGQVGYIDPQVQEETRTAKLRVEVPNAGDRLRFGMFVDVSVAGRASRPVVFVPKAAVQVVGARPVVYVAGAGNNGHFVERNVEVGDTIGNQIGIVAGIQAGELVVTDGAFFLRAEHERK